IGPVHGPPAPEAACLDLAAVPLVVRRQGNSADQPSQRRWSVDQTLDALLGFAPDYDSPIPYMARTREYYAAIGYTTPYRWAHYVDAPFQPLKKPLAQSRVTIITTAAPFDPAKGDQGAGAKYNGGAKFYSVYDGDGSKNH